MRAEEELSVEAFLDLIYEPDRAAVRRSLFGKRGDNDRYRVEFRVPHDGGIRWLLDCGRAFYDGDGETPVRVRGTVLDITERKLFEERQLLLMAELDHRVKNILANVGAIAKLSSKNSGSVSGFVEALEARIQAIARAHSMLRRDSWIGVDLRTYLSELLSPFISKRRQNIILEGRGDRSLTQGRPIARSGLPRACHERGEIRRSLRPGRQCDPLLVESEREEGRRSSDVAGTRRTETHQGSSAGFRLDDHQDCFRRGRGKGRLRLRP